jgi:hypothetical protein
MAIRANSDFHFGVVSEKEKRPVCYSPSVGSSSIEVLNEFGAWVTMVLTGDEARKNA